jgi:hypothetical protein
LEGVGPSKINNMNQPGGETWEFGGAVIEQAFSQSHEKAGKNVLAPNEFPWVLETTPRRDTLKFLIFPVVTWIW